MSSLIKEFNKNIFMRKIKRAIFLHHIVKEYCFFSTQTHHSEIRSYDMSMVVLKCRVLTV